MPVAELQVDIEGPAVAGLGLFEPLLLHRWAVRTECRDLRLTIIMIEIQWATAQIGGSARVS